MKFLKEKLSDLTDLAKKLINSPMKKAVVTTVAISSLAFHQNPVAFASDSKPKVVYQTYYNNTYLGAVSDKSVINKLVDQKLKTIKLSYEDMNLEFESQIKYIPEQVNKATADNESAIKKLQSILQLKAKAAAIVVDGKPVVYLENNNTAQEVIKKLEFQYVTEEQLKDFEARIADPKAVLPPLKENETRIINIQLSNNASVKEERVMPEEIMPAVQALGYIQKGTLEEAKYQVKNGDVLGSIASSHQLKLSDLLSLNPRLTENSVLKIGQELNITMPKPLVEVIVEKEVNQQETVPFQTEIKEDPSMPQGDSKISQEGQNGLQRASYHITEINGAVTNKEITKQDILQPPVNRVVIKGTKVIPSRGSGGFSWPACGGYISSPMGYRWGKLHKGIDIAGPSNRTIKAADNGIVTFAGWDNGGYGNEIIIDHQNGFTTLYGHLASIGVRVGQVVEKGIPIGVMGETGDATGIHLHFEVHKNGALQNPSNYVSR